MMPLACATPLQLAFPVLLTRRQNGNWPLGFQQNGMPRWPRACPGRFPQYSLREGHWPLVTISLIFIVLIYVWVKMMPNPDTILELARI